jgi:hypothetical protein
MRVSKLLGHVSNERGQVSERRLVDAVQNLATLGAQGLNTGRAWITSVRLATKAEDACGIDVVVETDVGPLYLQSKSSPKEAQRFRQKKRSRLIVAVVVPADDALLLGRTRAALDVLHAEVLKIRNGAK